ncbi:hypothetical protein NIES4075_73500 [Tolypothrix sp. NIES-4075]|nr:hypothetical protein NIES4075_73500 [Tolypothrix sp. NIES-4075]
MPINGRSVGVDSSTLSPKRASPHKKSKFSTGQLYLSIKNSAIFAWFDFRKYIYFLSFLAWFGVVMQCDASVALRRGFTALPLKPPPSESFYGRFRERSKKFSKMSFLSRSELRPLLTPSPLWKASFFLKFFSCPLYRLKSGHTPHLTRWRTIVLVWFLGAVFGSVA